jgi:hypothetical protein
LQHKSVRQKPTKIVGGYGNDDLSALFPNSLAIVGRSLVFQGVIAMKIAVMPGDGVGKEVIPAGLSVLEQAARKFGFTIFHHRLPLRR